ncbi:hypothetical protein [Thiobacter aerophilum]|uniref:DUF2199 domain-containing protein n=1 Tax=Thiobacter aerophilum TaxID=3121275 RepID=A0ABV0EGS0_9BURK
MNTPISQELPTPGNPLQLTGSETLVCPCGCGRPYVVSGGSIHYGEQREVEFEPAFVSHSETDRHLWLALITGPWRDDDAGECWVFVHGLPQENGVAGRIEDVAASPWGGLPLGGRAIPREEVLANPAARDWVLERFNEVMQYHPDVAPFIYREEQS